LIRELVLQLKLGSVTPQYFRDKYGVDILQRFAGEFNGLRNEGYLSEASEQRVGADAERPALRRRPPATLLPAASTPASATRSPDERKERQGPQSI
jgi:hypothetical protein